ncbi:MAG TPA: YihY/virulence factor BrkB family protein [Nocardioidaceae bacterium]|nr:YihY/virulence factor BrkB family protein [Nocardioidaceae bacterium]
MSDAGARSDKPKLTDRLKAKIEAARRRWPVFDHVMTMQEHYARVNGNVLAAGATYFGFLSFFPILALAFYVAGKVSDIYPDATDAVSEAITSVLPGIIANEPTEGKITIDQIQGAANIAGIVGLLGVLYAGLGWLSGLRSALVTALGVPKSEKRNFFVGKAFDLVTLASVGLVMVVSVGLSGGVRGFADDILDFVGLSGGFGQVLLNAVTVVLGLIASTVLFYVIYRLLPKPELPARAIWKGAVFAGVGFEALKALVLYVLGSVGGTPFAPLALAVTLVVWINYISRLTVYGAAWAYTDAAAVATRRAVDRAMYSRPAATIIDERGFDDPATGATAGERLVAVARPVAVLGLVAVGIREYIRRSGEPRSEERAER